METIYVIETQSKLQKIIDGETSPNGQECRVYTLSNEELAFSHKFYIRYDSIFGIGFVYEDGRVFRGQDKLAALTNAMKGEI